MNDPNCLSVENNRCLECAPTHYIDVSGTCRQLPPNCQFANIQTGDCLQCVSGWVIQNAGGPCVRQLPPNCQSANAAGACVICNQGYETNNGQCIERINIPNCNVVDSVNRRCVSCADRFFPSNSSCVPVSQSCNGYNPVTGQCTSCRQGNTLTNGVCNPTPVVTNPTTQPPGNQGATVPGTTVPGTSTVPGTQINVNGTQTNSNGGQFSDPNCRANNGQVCTQCSNRFYIASNGRCVPVSPLCRNNDAQGRCTSCYPGYSVFEGNCIIAQNTDSNCRNSTAQGCIECYSGFYVSQTTRVCTRVNPLCRTFNNATGACTSCYPGYGINTVNGNCEVSFKDPNCKQFDSNNICVECGTRFYASASGTCQSVSPLCREYNPSNGACTSCYPGYTVNGTTCVVGSVNNDVNCRTFQNDVCTACYNGFFLNANGLCAQVSPLCRTFNNATGACTSCYPGYEISGDNCVEARSRDPNCKTFSSDTSNVCR